MDQDGGLWIRLDDERRAEKIEASILRDDSFTMTVLLSDVHLKKFDLVLISLAGEHLDYIGVSKVGRHVATDTKVISISTLVDLSHLPLDRILNRLPNRLRVQALSATNKCVRLSSALWTAVIAHILRERPDLNMEIERLKSLVIKARAWRNQVGGVEALERDAIATAIEAWGGRSVRKRVLRSAARSEKGFSASFLSRLEGFVTAEDLLISQDQGVFPGFEVAIRSAIGAIELRGESDSLTILNCNRQPLEHTLGVDLIYYSQKYHAFVLVQYKKMSRCTAQGLAYYPSSDHNHESELKRMAEVDDSLCNLPITTPTLYNRRLSERPFYFKLCNPIIHHELDDGMVPGMYVPLDVWRCLLTDPVAKGPRGGIVIGWESCPRRFNNSEFTDLLRKGWIGSSSSASERLESLIETILAAKRMLVIAGVRVGTNRIDYWRDGFGRFAPPNDPLASH